MNNSSTKRRSSVKKLLVIALSLIVFLAVYTVAFQWYVGPPAQPDFPKLKWHAPIESLRELADSLEDDNAAKYYIMACLEMTPVRPSAIYEDCCPDTDEDGQPIDIREVEACIAAHEQIFVLVKEGIGRNRYSLPAGNLFEGSHMMHFRRLSRLLETKGRLQENKSEYEEAAETYMDILFFSADLYNNSSIFGALVGIGSEHGAYRGLESVVSHLDDEELCEELLKELIEMADGRAPLRQIIALNNLELKDSARGGAGYSLHWGDPLIDPGAADYFLDTMRRSGAYLWSGLTTPLHNRKMDKLFQALADISEKPYLEILREPLEDRAPGGTLSEILLPGIEKFFISAAWQETKRRANIVRVALHLYRLRNGEYPESLDELSATVPDHAMIDPFSADRFNYKRTDDGYLLYSLGRDLDDDGGKDGGGLYPMKDYDGDMVFGPFTPASPPQA